MQPTHCKFHSNVWMIEFSLRSYPIWPSSWPIRNKLNLYWGELLERKLPTHCKFRNNVCGVWMCKIVIEFFLKEPPPPHGYVRTWLNGRRVLRMEYLNKGSLSYDCMWYICIYLYNMFRWYICIELNCTQLYEIVHNIDAYFWCKQMSWSNIITYYTLRNPVPSTYVL